LRAAERSLLAWVRTSLSMITFGFTIYKFLQFIRQQSGVPLPRPQAPRNLGLALIGIGTFALIAACIQHVN
jgi:putative membrane protein